MMSGGTTASTNAVAPSRADADPTRWSVAETAAQLRSGTTTSLAVTDAYLAQIAASDDAIGAYLTVTADVARAQARSADARRAAGEDGPLLGVPYALKDLFTTAGVRTTAGSRMLADYVPPDDSAVYARLSAAGAVLLGKTNMDEFAMGSSTENSAFHPTANPWDVSRVPGGSSGGSTAAVAAGMAAFAIGTDTGGSIRQPAALCGVVGLKPTYGRVSRRGMVAFASSLDQAGPITRTAKDAAVVLGAVAGLDPLDATSGDVGVPDYGSALNGDVTGLRLGILDEYFAAGLDPEVRAAVEAAIDVLVAAGAVRVRVQLPSVRYAVATYYLIATAECSANLARYDGFRYGASIGTGGVWERLAAARGAGFGEEVKRRIILGTNALSTGYFDAYYAQATRVRGLIRTEFERALEACDVIVGPTVPAPAFRRGEKMDDPLAMYLNDIYTIALNLAGLPGASVPCGFVAGLPVGLQIMGRAFDEASILRTADAYEARTAWSTRAPAVPADAASIRPPRALDA